MPRMDGLSLLAKLQEHEEKLSTIISFGLRRHGQHPHCDESWRVRFPNEAN